jgi:DNA-binding FadR family transcriptional regulator
MELERLMAAYRQVMQAICDATHNRVIQQLAQPLLNLRNLRTWADVEGDPPETIIAVETNFMRQLMAAIAGRDPAQARTVVKRMMELPPEAMAAMQQTPVGEITIIPVPLPKQRE